MQITFLDVILLPFAIIGLCAFVVLGAGFVEWINANWETDRPKWRISPPPPPPVEQAPKEVIVTIRVENGEMTNFSWREMPPHESSND